MSKDNSPPQEGGDSGGFPPQSPPFVSYAAPSSSFAMGDPPPSSSSNPPCQSGHFDPQEAGHYSHDISQMPDAPPRNPGHRRAHSEILGLPDDLTFDTDLGVVRTSDGPLLSDENDDELFSMFINVEKFNSFGPASPGASEGESSMLAAVVALNSENSTIGSHERPRHHFSQSMDLSNSIKTELLGLSGDGPSPSEAKKAISAAKLAELALVDPKRAKRIWANRQSAARSKERKMRYIAELEQRLQTLQTDATTLLAQLTLIQRDTTGLTAENSELKLRLQTMEQQVHMQDVLNDALKAEVQRLKIATGQIANDGGMNFGLPPSFGAGQQYYHNQEMQSLLAAHQLRRLQIHQKPLHPHHPQMQLPMHVHQTHHLQQQQPVPLDLKLKGPVVAPTRSGVGKSDDRGAQIQ